VGNRLFQSVFDGRGNHRLCDGDRTAPLKRSGNGMKLERSILHSSLTPSKNHVTLKGNAEVEKRSRHECGNRI